MQHLKRIGVDILGVVLIAASIIFGWLPGVGGIPLFLAGLGLLATNHQWAKRWLEHFKTHGLRLAQAFFREHKLLMLAYDIFAIIFLAAATAILIKSSDNIFRSLAFVLLFFSSGLFLGNRQRLQRLQKLVRHKKDKH